MSTEQEAKEYCRMSWYLVKMDEGESKDGKSNGRIAYDIIHSVDIIDEDSEYMFVNRKIRFNRRQFVIEGEILCASDDRESFKKQLRILRQQNVEAIFSKSLERHILVQYTKDANTVVHAIVEEKDTAWPQTFFSKESAAEILVRHEKVFKLSTVLHVSDSDDLMQRQFKILKEKTFQVAFIDPDDSKDIKETPWLLLQYSKCPKSVAYSIVHLKNTVLQNENLFSNVVAYLKVGTAMLQAVIVRKSNNRDEIVQGLQAIKSFYSTYQFPLLNGMNDNLADIV